MKAKKLIFYCMFLIVNIFYGINILSLNSFNSVFNKGKTAFRAGAQKTKNYIYKNKKTAAALGVGVFGLSGYYAWKRYQKILSERAIGEVASEITNKIDVLEHKANELRAIYKAMEADPALPKRINPTFLGFQKMKQDADEVAEAVLRDINNAKKPLNLKIVGNIKLNTDWLKAQKLTTEYYINNIKNYYNFILIYWTQ